MQFRGLPHVSSRSVQTLKYGAYKSSKKKGQGFPFLQSTLGRLSQVLRFGTAAPLEPAKPKAPKTPRVFLSSTMPIFSETFFSEIH